MARTSQMGSGVPQKREREMHQSRAPSSQLWKRLSRTCSGTQYVSCRAASSASESLRQSAQVRGLLKTGS